MTVVYFLFEKGKLIYIGKSRDWPFRLKAHIQQEMPFDSTKFIEYPDDKVDKMERFYIEKYKPLLNINKGRKESYYKPKHKYFRKAYKSKRMKLRKLTEKSIVGFGKHLHATVHSLNPLRIANLYFTCSHINFFDDVLDRAGITPEWRIEKPGTGDYWKFAKEVLGEDLENKQKMKNGNLRLNSLRNMKYTNRISNAPAHNRSYNQKPRGY